MNREERNKVKVKALRDYEQNELLAVIAIRYGVSIATISLWARVAGLKRRQQGCREKQRPREQDIAIVNAVKAAHDGKPSLAEIGRHWSTVFGEKMSRANVHRIYKTWKNWKPDIPFKRGDKVRFMGCDYEVITPNVFGGLVRDLRTGEISTINWRQHSRVGKKKRIQIAVKLNVEHREPQPAEAVALSG